MIGIKIIKKITQVFLCFFLFILSTLSIMAVSVTFTHLETDQAIKSFIAKGVFEKTEHENGVTVSYYKVESDLDVPLTHPSIDWSFSTPILGYPGDFYIQQESAIPIPIIKDFISFYFGGHAGLITHNFDILETTGMNATMEENIITKFSNILLEDPDPRDIIGLRVKGITDDEINKALEYAESKIGIPYNYTFLLNRNKSFYCTDFIARAFGKETGLSYQLDSTGFWTTTQDLVHSKDTFITFYKQVKGDKINLYYLVEKS